MLQQNEICGAVMVIDSRCEQVQLFQVQGHLAEWRPPQRTGTKRKINQRVPTLGTVRQGQESLGTTCLRRSLDVPLMLARPGPSVGLLQVERVIVVARFYTRCRRAGRAALGIQPAL